MKKLNAVIKNKLGKLYMNKKLSTDSKRIALSIFLWSISAVLLPDLASAANGSGISNITDLKGLTKVVKTDIQSYGLPIILNAAGICISGFALITQRWQYLFFGAAFIIFVNLYFGFVNGNFNVQ